jgi:hypothetical protein
MEYSSLKLALDNKTPKENEKTEFEEFENWFNVSLRYGVLPFTITKLGYKKKWNTKTEVAGIYQFTAGSLKYDKVQGIVLASFGLEEVSTLPEVEHTFLATNDGQILLTNSGRLIAV